MSAPDTTTLRLRIEGSVQAVGYRYFAMEEARRLALDGWIRNRSDGTVESLVSGNTQSVEAFVTICMRGPPGARVTNIEMHKADPPDGPGFHRRPSL